MASFPPMIIPVTSSFNIPVQSTLSYEHNETLPSAVIQRFPVFRAGGDRGQFVRKGGLVAILDCNPKTSRKVSKSNESSYIAIEGDSLTGDKNAKVGIRALYPAAEAMQLLSKSECFVACAVSGSREIAVGSKGVVEFKNGAATVPVNSQGATVKSVEIRPGDRLYATAKPGDKLEFYFTKTRGDFELGIVTTYAGPGEQIVTIA